MRKFSNAQDQQSNVHPVSARVAEITEQIQEIADRNVAYRTKLVRTQVDHSAHQVRELRLIQIKEELKQMLKNPV
jgi:Iap family predicted aminopeptidase